MNKDILTIYDSDKNKKDYKLLFIIEKDFKYIIYTDIDNNDLTKNLYAVKVKNKNKESLEITDNEWKMIKKEYMKLLNN